MSGNKQKVGDNNYNKLSGSKSTTNGQGKMNDMTTNQKLEEIQKNVNSVIVIVNENIVKVLERGEKIEKTLENTEELKNNSERFRISTRRLRRKICIENAKKSALIIFILLIIIAIIALLIYYGTKN